MKEAIKNLREAWKFYQACKKDPDAGKTGARADAREWLHSAVEEVLKKAR